MANPPTRATPKPPAPAAKAYDLDALRTAVDDAAKASGPLWASYILALFYFLVAAGGVTHKDMFLERPVKLPFLGVDLPIVGFFIVTPPVFVLLHAYVLLTFAVMARKVEAFDGALVQQIGNAERRQAMRRQLSSSLFVQSLAGPRELRQGIVGLLLRAVAVVSLMAGPVVLLLFLQLQFLPYHSHGATWSARLSLCADLVFLWLLWQRLQLPPLPIAGRGRWRYVGKLPGYLARALCRAGTVAALWLAFCIGTFPGEALDDLGRGGWMRETLIDGRAFWPTEYGPRINMMKGLELPANDPMAGVDMVRHRPTTWFTNRLIVMNFDIAEDDRFNSQEKYDLHAVTFDLRAHDLRRAVLSNSDLRKADLTGAMLTQAVLDGANLNHAKLDGAQMQGASLMDARMQGASLIRSEMQGALLDGAQMQGASFDGAQMQGASLNGAKIQGASLVEAHMQGASLYGAQMQGALLYGTKMQGASLVGAHMQGASLYGAQMLGSDLTGARLDNTELHRPALWRARVDRATLTEAILADPWLDRVAGAEDGILEILGVPLPWTHDNYADLKQQVEQAIPAGAAREDAAERIARLDPAVPPGPDQAANDAETDALEAFGKQRLYPRFSGAARTIDDFDWKGWAQALGDLGCTDETPPFLVAGLARNFIDYFLFRPTGIPEEAQRALAKRFSDPACTGAAGLDPVLMRQLTEAARDPPPAAQ